MRINKIFCLGRNYAAHAKEMSSGIPETPVVFLKPSTAVIQDNEPILKPSISNLLHHEVELYVAIGKGGRNISLDKAHNHIAGYGVALDMTLRDLQNSAKKEGQPWAVCKGFDTSAPISELIPAEDIKDPYSLTIRCCVNGSEKQRSSTGKMILKIDYIIHYLSSIFTLERGDLIFTGTPEGVGEAKAGDIIEAELVGYTKITNPVR